MSEQVLYRKYRPAKWSEVIGQEQVVTVLSGAIKLGRVGHAYLFHGSRGTGKTSVARIFAQAVGTSQNDLYEIDAASSRGIDEIRELKEAVRSLPFESTYKIYIIDEVHMLTKEAFNALLKTLEEPPKHVIFILATTELAKLPETIISRCQTFTFKKPTVEVLKKYVVKTATKEGFSISEESAGLIAMLGDGSFRDTLGILQKVLSLSADKVLSPAEVEAVTGAPKEQYVYDLVLALLAAKSDLALTVIEKAINEGHDVRILLKMTLNVLRQAMLIKFSPAVSTQLKNELSQDTFERLSALANHEKSDSLASLLRGLLDIHDEVSRAYLPQLPLELAVIKLTRAG